MSEATAAARPASVSDRYAALEERILDRDQVGASEVYYDLHREGRPLEEMLLEATRIHGPYTHVPYHERIDDGFVNFVNNDHCLLSARATLNLVRLLPPEAAGLAMAQTIWYIPTGLDIWNQKILKAPGALRAGREAAPRPAAGPGGPLAGPGAGACGASGRPAPRAARPLAHPRAARSGPGRVPVLPRPHGRAGAPARGACRARLRGPHRRAGPHALQPLVHHRPQGLPRPRHRRTRRRDRMGPGAPGPLRGGPRHGGRPALVLDLRDGVQRDHGLHRGGSDLRDSVLRHDGARARPRRQLRPPDPGRDERSRSQAHPGARAGRGRAHRRASPGGETASRPPRRDPDRSRSDRHRDPEPEQLLDVPALLPVRQHPRLVHGELRAPPPGQAHIPRRRVSRTDSPPSGPHRRHAADRDRGARRERNGSHPARSSTAWRRPTSLSTSRRAKHGRRRIWRAARTGRRSWSGSRSPPAARGTIRTTRRSRRSCSRTACAGGPPIRTGC